MAKNNLAPPSSNALTLDDEVQQTFGLDPAAQRSTILPFYSKRTGWVAPEILYQAARAAVAPGFAWKGGQVTPQDAMNFASTVGGGGLAASVAAPAPANALGMFVGRRAKTWNLRAMQNAELLEKAGVSPEEIWRRWGTWRGPDGEWRQEISDAGMQIQKPFESLGMTKESNYQYPTAAPMNQQISHPELYAAYPQLESVPTQVHKLAGWLPDSAQTGSASIGVNSKTWAMDTPKNLSVRSKTEQTAKQSIAHEGQHMVQAIEGFAQGGNETSFYASARKMLESNDPEWNKLSDAEKGDRVSAMAFKMYQGLMGEAEARATQVRQTLTAEQRRARFPGLDYDLPIDMLRRE